MSTLFTSAQPKASGLVRAGLVVLVAAIAVAPWLGSAFTLHLAVLTCLNILIVNGLALISRCGQLSLGHAAFVAVGAYASVLLTTQASLGFVPALLLGALAAALVALLLGWVILRLKGVYFVLVTFAFGELVRLALLDWPGITGGANGIASIPPAELLGFVFDTRSRFYALALALALLSIALLHALFKRPLGHAVDAVADNPALAESTGISVHHIQVFCFVCGCALAGVGGGLMARYIGFVSPESFNTSISIGFIIMLVIGGRRSLWGPAIGAIVLTPLPELFRGAVQTQHIFYGAALILMLRFLPGGLASAAQRYAVWRRKEHA